MKAVVVHVHTKEVKHAAYGHPSGYGVAKDAEVVLLRRDHGHKTAELAPGHFPLYMQSGKLWLSLGQD